MLLEFHKRSCFGILLNLEIYVNDSCHRDNVFVSFSNCCHFVVGKPFSFSGSILLFQQSWKFPVEVKVPVPIL